MINTHVSCYTSTSPAPRCHRPPPLRGFGERDVGAVGRRVDVRSRAEHKYHAARPKHQYTISRVCGNRQDLHQSMRKPDLGAVDGAVARRLDQRQEVMVARVDDDVVERFLQKGETTAALAFARAGGAGAGEVGFAP